MSWPFTKSASNKKQKKKKAFLNVSKNFITINITAKCVTDFFHKYFLTVILLLRWLITKRNATTIFFGDTQSGSLIPFYTNYSAYDLLIYTIWA